MTSCPHCGSVELRIHGARVHLEYRRQWGFFGPVRPRPQTVAVECSCADCLFAFVVRPHGTTAAPIQTAHDQLEKAQAAANGGAPKGPASSDDERPRSRGNPRPASDPRVRRR